MIHLYLVRHAAAVESHGSTPDDQRPLLGKARKRFRRIARALARRGEKLGVILTSPLVRAVQTAEILAGEVRHGEVEVLAELAPGHAAETLLRAVAKRSRKQDSLALVGHEPQLSAVVAALAHLSPTQSSRLDFKSGLVVRIDVTDLPTAKPAQPRWWLKPRSGARKKGLPLQEPVEKKPRPPAGKKAASPRMARKPARRKKAASGAKPLARKVDARPPARPAPKAEPVRAIKKSPAAAAKPAPRSPSKPKPAAAPPARPQPASRKTEPPSVAPQKFMGTPRLATPPAAAPSPPSPVAPPPPGNSEPEEP